MYTLFLSDEAYERLIDMARMVGGVNPENYNNARGIHKLIPLLMKSDLRDARPDDIREQDATMLSARCAPEWAMYGPRVRRRIRVQPDMLVLASAHALRLGLAYLPQQRIRGAPTIDEGARCLAALLEAIGCGWVETDLNDE